MDDGLKIFFGLIVFFIIIIGVCAIAFDGSNSKPYDKANIVCGKAKPLKIIQHDDGTASWLEVKCADGTERAVKF